MTRLVLVRQKYTSSGGAERFVSRALSVLQAHHLLDVHLIARYWEPVAGIQAHLLNPFYLGSVWRDFSFARAAKKFWQNEHFDLIQSHERIAGCHIYRAGDGVHAQWLHLREQSRGWTGKIAHFFNPYHHYIQYVEKQMFLDPELRVVICNSKMVKDEIQRYFGLNNEQFAIIYNGVDQKIFSPNVRQYRENIRAELDIHEDTPTLLYVGSGFERKGVRQALYALQSVSSVSLIVVGKDKKAAKYRALAEKLGVAQRCYFIGAVNDVRPYLGAADAFILPTLYDPLPNACIEALACGLPVITSKTCGVAELIQEGENGFIADALDLSSWSIAVKKWLEAYKANTQRLSDAAVASVSHLTLETMGQQLMTLYEKLLAD